jgi:alpha,alpha-trehalase
MKERKLARFGPALAAALALGWLGCRAESSPKAALPSPRPVATSALRWDWPQTPAQAFQELFEDVQMAALFDDDKTFADALAYRPAPDVLSDYRRQKAGSGFELRTFVAREFSWPSVDVPPYRTEPGTDVATHIERLWTVLTRPAARAEPGSSLLALPYPYVVPGGRFREIYYWDSYFTMLGLAADGRHELVRSMCDDFAFSIERYGHVPNGNRSYYLSRSQPPFFASMVELVVAQEGTSAYARYRPALLGEYAFWMDGEAEVSAGQAFRRVVRLADGGVLNRYWDDLDTPRDEAYRADVLTARRSRRPAADVYRNLRAAAESGWDFSSRWLADPKELSSIRTVELVPVDLNSLLHGLEQTLARAHDAVEPRRAAEFRERAERRRRSLSKHLYDPRLRAFSDLHWADVSVTGQLTAATVVPLFFGLATVDQAAAVAGTLEAKLLDAHGLGTTLLETGQQWDAPNGWAPLQWMAIEGLRRYGHVALADEIARRFIDHTRSVFASTGKLLEKYDVTAGGGLAGGGEYPLQDGFGWTNGVLAALLRRPFGRAETQRSLGDGGGASRPAGGVAAQCSVCVGNANGMLSRSNAE